MCVWLWLRLWLLPSCQQAVGLLTAAVGVSGFAMAGCALVPTGQSYRGVLMFFLCVLMRGGCVVMMFASRDVPPPTHPPPPLHVAVGGSRWRVLRGACASLHEWGRAWGEAQTTNVIDS